MEEISANQSAEPVVTETAAPETSAAETVTTPSSEPSGIKVKFNKEERIIGLDEAPNWIQKGLNYDKVSERASQADQFAKNLERVANFNGYESTDDFLKAIEQAELNEQAQKVGMDPEVYRQQQELTSKLSTLEQRLQSYEMKDIRYSQDKTLESDPNLGELYKQFRDDVHQLADKANTDYDVAFTLLLRDKIPSLISGLKNQTEQEVLAKVTGRDDKQVLSSNDQPNNLMHTPSNMSFKDIEDISKRVQAGEKIKF